MPIIYCTTNKINGKKYIGADVNDNPKYFGSGTIIKLAIKKYGKNNFIKETLERCSSEQLMYEREEYWVDFHNAVESKEYYNLSPGGKGGNKLNNPDSIRKHRKNSFDLSKYNKDLKGKTYEEIYGENAKIEKQKRRDSLTGVKHTLERRKKNSLSQMGRTPWNKGLTKEIDERVSKYIKNRRPPLYTKEYILTTPTDEVYIFKGRELVKEFFKIENQKFTLKSKIRTDLLITNGENKGYKIKVIPIRKEKQW